MNKKSIFVFFIFRLLPGNPGLHQLRPGDRLHKEDQSEGGEERDRILPGPGFCGVRDGWVVYSGYS